MRPGLLSIQGAIVYEGNCMKAESAGQAEQVFGGKRQGRSTLTFEAGNSLSLLVIMMHHSRCR